MSASTPFDFYKEEFESVLLQIEQCLQSEEDASDLIDQCETLLPQLSIEARGAPDPCLKQELLDVVSAYKVKFQSYKDENKRKGLFASMPPGADARYRERMMLPQDRVRQQNQTILNALQSVNETEQVAIEIGQELSKNRETIENAQDNVDQVSSMAERAKGLLMSMRRRRW
jgi:hypothetical protein